MVPLCCVLYINGSFGLVVVVWIVLKIFSEMDLFWLELVFDGDFGVVEKTFGGSEKFRPNKT